MDDFDFDFSGGASSVDGSSAFGAFAGIAGLIVALLGVPIFLFQQCTKPSEEELQQQRVAHAEQVRAERTFAATLKRDEAKEANTPISDVLKDRIKDKFHDKAVDTIYKILP